MISVLVAHAYFLALDPKQKDRAKPYPPLATLQVAAMLREAGHRVAVFDAMLAGGPGDFDPAAEGSPPALALFYEDSFNFLSKMCLGRMRDAAFEMIGRARRAGTRVIVAGSDASDAPEAYLAAGAEIVLLGEGLGTLRALVERLDVEPHLPVPVLAAGLAGLAVRGPGGEAVRVRAGAAHPAPQQPAQAARDLVDVDRYRDAWRRAHGYFSLNMASSRGCPFRCHWCAKPIWGNHYLQRSAGDVAAEMTWLKRTFAPDHVWFADDIFGFRVDWVQAFAECLRAAGGFVPFSIQTRADLVSERMADALVAAGCTEAWLGAESGSQRVLDAMNKGTTVAEIHQARARLRERGIRVGFFIQLGYLGEELEDLLATRELVETARPDDIGVSVAYPLPGTRFHEIVAEQLRHKKNWEDSGELAMMFEGTYATAFYREVRDLLHAGVTLDASGAGRDARRAHARRWQALLAQERAQRLSPRDPSPAPRPSKAAACIEMPLRPRLVSAS